MPPEETVWPLEDHSRGKHLVLERYLKAWLPILGTTRGRIVFIDGFAGPGEYSTGERGSPIIALDAFQNHAAIGRMREIRFLFLEAREDRAAHLEQLLRARYPSLPAQCHYQVHHGECAPAVTGLLDELDQAGSRLAPSLLMLDPFGVQGLPMAMVRRFLGHSSTEVYVSFMYEAMRRFFETPEFAPHLDELFGTNEWRETLHASRGNPEAGRLATYALYERQLRAAGAQFVLHFDIYNGGRLIYTIFFATSSRLGCDRMKEAIWRVMPAGDFLFRGTRESTQMTLDLAMPMDDHRLEHDLLEYLQRSEWTSMETLGEWIQTDEIAFHSANFKPGLKRLEEQGRIEARRREGGRRGTFPPGVAVRVRQLAATDG